MARSYEVTNMALSYRTMLRDIMMYGDWTSPRGIATREFTNVTIEHQRPESVLLTGIGRNLSTGLAALEALQLVGGFCDVGLVTKVAPRYKDFLDGDSFHGAYGLRTQYKLGLVAERLHQDPYTRRACVTMWEDRLDLSQEGLHDYPCTMHANFRMRDIGGNIHGSTVFVLDMTIVMRSNDLWLGYPYDAVQFSILHSTMAAFLGVHVGTYTHIVHSLHLYERDLLKVRELLDNEFDIDTSPQSLSGGISARSENWIGVQNRAQTLCYSPEKINPKTPAEEWLKRASLSRIQASL
jgi:thymidylate synthase